MRFDLVKSCLCRSFSFSETSSSGPSHLILPFHSLQSSLPQPWLLEELLVVVVVSKELKELEQALRMSELPYAVVVVSEQLEVGHVLRVGQKP